MILPRLYMGKYIFHSANPYYYLHDRHEETLDFFGCGWQSLVLPDGRTEPISSHSWQYQSLGSLISP